MSSFAPKTYAWGKFLNCPPDTYFLLLDFLPFREELVEPFVFCARLAELHLMSLSPTGMFGFPITTYHGPNEQNVEWNSDWEVAANGPWPTYQWKFEQLISHCVSRILKPLQSEGRLLLPSLIHGDLWEGNTGTHCASGKPIVFDAAAMYAHNEFGLGMWQREIVRFGSTYTEHYLRNYPPSEPVEQGMIGTGYTQ
ncbi:hypothetical protein MMC27_007993 [Xylographa pallens]|nr:hypothetical protein [Xylographa pallens]